MAKTGLVYVPHLRRSVTWEMDLTDWPFAPVNYEGSQYGLDRYDGECDHDYAQRKRMREHAYRYGQHFLQVPLPDDECYDAYHAFYREHYLRDMAVAGHWDLQHWRRAAAEPIPTTIVFRRDEFPADALMAHAMHKAGLFESIGEARRNGWQKPMACGLYWVSGIRRVLISDGIEPRRANMLSIHAHFDTGDDLVIDVHEEPEGDPVADWGCWCRRWTGEDWETYWRHFEQCRRSEAVQACCYEIDHIMRLEPESKNRKLEVILPAVSRSGSLARYSALAMQVERSRASIDGWAPRKFAGLAVRRR